MESTHSHVSTQVVLWWQMPSMGVDLVETIDKTRVIKEGEGILLHYGIVLQPFRYM